MARVLALSSQVARGHIGLSAIVPALHRLAHEVWPLPTVILSNHPGHVHAAGMPIAPAVLEEMFDALDRNGWLGEIDAIITGYLPTEEHVQLASAIVQRLKANRPVLYLCDPVMGDEPKGLYLDPKAANALRNELVKIADIITPNRFELGWLTGQPVATIEGLRSAARALKVSSVLVTSAFRNGSELENILLTPDQTLRCKVAWHPDVPHGTGDFFAALFLGHSLNRQSEADALARSTAGVEQAVLSSRGRDELVLVASQDAWAGAEAPR